MVSFSRDRLLSLDILRGVAVFGVLLVNGPSMNSPVLLDGTDFAFKDGYANSLYADFILSFATCNFYPIFACLFGVSAAMILSKNNTNIYLRRMAMLLLFGLLQGFFIWWGDVLAIYSLIGFSMLFLAKQSQKTVLRVMLFTAMVCVAISLIALFVTEGGDFYPHVNSLQAYQENSFFLVTKQRVLDYTWTYAPWLLAKIDLAQIVHTYIFVAQLYLCFTVGFYLQTSALLEKILNDKKLAFKIFIISLISTTIVSISLAYFKLENQGLYLLDGFSRGMFYSCTIFYACHFSNIRLMLSPLASVGRMSLSNYLLHNFIISLTLYGYGLGLYAAIGPFEQLPILLGLMIFSLVFSHLWLKFFQFGPLEWIWRMVSHKKRLSLLATA